MVDETQQKLNKHESNVSNIGKGATVNDFNKLCGQTSTKYYLREIWRVEMLIKNYRQHIRFAFIALPLYVITQLVKLNCTEFDGNLDDEEAKSGRSLLFSPIFAANCIWG